MLKYKVFDNKSGMPTFGKTRTRNENYYILDINSIQRTNWIVELPNIHIDLDKYKNIDVSRLFQAFRRALLEVEKDMEEIKLKRVVKEKKVDTIKKVHQKGQKHEYRPKQKFFRSRLGKSR